MSLSGRCQSTVKSSSLVGLPGDSTGMEGYMNLYAVIYYFLYAPISGRIIKTEVLSLICQTIYKMHQKKVASYKTEKYGSVFTNICFSNFRIEPFLQC